jgi:hypothetical protein
MEIKYLVYQAVMALHILLIPLHLPPLDCISERLVALRLPFMQIRWEDMLL